MKCIKKLLACTLLATTVVAMGDVNDAKADYDIPGCTSTERIVCCIGPMSSSGVKVPHLVYNSADEAVYCGIVTLYGNHDLYCKRCYGFVDRVGLTHARYHDICAPETDLCQQGY